MLKKVRKTVDSSPIWIEKRDESYVGYSSFFNALLGATSPPIMCGYSQSAMKNAYETGKLKGDL